MASCRSECEEALGPRPVMRGDKKGQEGDAEGHSGPGQPSSQRAACQDPGPLMMHKPGTSGQSVSLKETPFGLLWTKERINLPVCPLGLLFIHLVPLIESLPCAGCSWLWHRAESESVPTTTDLWPEQTQVRNSVRVRTQPTSRRGTLPREWGRPESFLEEVKT